MNCTVINLDYKAISNSRWIAYTDLEANTTKYVFSTLSHHIQASLMRSSGRKSAF